MKTSSAAEKTIKRQPELFQSDLAIAVLPSKMETGENQELAEVGRHDLNLALRACFVLSRKDMRKNVIRKWAVKDKEGKRQEFTLEIKSPDRLPWFRDNECLMAFIEIAKEENSQEISPSLYKVLKLMGLPTDSGRSYETLARMLDRLQAPQLRGTFWHNGEKKWVKYITWDHLIEAASLKYEVDKKTGVAVGKGLKIRLGNLIWLDILSGNLLTYDKIKYRSLSGGDGIKALFLYMSGVRSEHWEVDIFQLEDTHLGMVPSKYPSVAWKKVRVILEQAKSQGLLKNYELVKHGKFTRVLLEKPAKQLSVPRQQELWHKVLDQLRASVTFATFETWFAPLKLQSFKKGCAIIGVPNERTREWVEAKYKSNLESAFLAAGETLSELRFELSPKAK